MSTAALPFRILPRITDRNRFFWTGGEVGELRFLRCDDCGTFVHPPVPVCPTCLGRSLRPHAVSGRAVLTTFTVNHHAWMPGPELPYVVAIVDIDEAPGVRLTTNIVGVEPDAVQIGMPLRVAFEQHPDPDDPASSGVWLPLFEPADT